MISIGAYPHNIDVFKGKAWSLADQLASFAAPFTPSLASTASLIEPHIVPLVYTQTTLKPGHILEGQDLTASLLNESLEYFQKALYNFNSQYLLAQNGYQTWAEVTNYYSSYFSIFALLALQGRIISRVSLDGVNKIPCLLHPIDIRNHQYVLTTKESTDSTHRLPWNKYYEIYDHYVCLKPEFDVVQLKGFVTEPKDESEFRNRVNYKIYEGFQEAINITHLTSFKQQYLNALITPVLGDTVQNYLTALHALATDPDLKYFARSALRLLLIRTLFEEIGNVNANFKTEFLSRIPSWQATMFDNYTPKRNYYEDFVTIFLV
ncbi:hypothetical protein ACTJIJ_25030 [Niabella sp. 22666]|uniref:hypothetical protein n=1 Tax=Niabella sp. 22666 TaxID=3453954 RepID=UPI003F84A711